MFMMRTPNDTLDYNELLSAIPYEAIACTPEVQKGYVTFHVKLNHDIDIYRMAMATRKAMKWASPIVVLASAYVAKSSRWGVSYLGVVYVVNANDLTTHCKNRQAHETIIDRDGNSKLVDNKSSHRLIFHKGDKIVFSEANAGNNLTGLMCTLRPYQCWNLSLVLLLMTTAVLCGAWSVSGNLVSFISVDQTLYNSSNPWNIIAWT